MFTTQYDQFQRRQEIFIILLGVAVIALSILLPVPTIIRIALLAVGGWLCVSRNLPAIIRASDVVDKRNGNLPVYRYDFFPDRIRLSDESFRKALQTEGSAARMDDHKTASPISSMNIDYSKITRLVEDRQYGYLFTGPSTVMMLDWKNLNPHDVDAFRKFLEEKTGKEFKKAHSFLMLTLRDILHA